MKFLRVLLQERRSLLMIGMRLLLDPDESRFVQRVRDEVSFLCDEVYDPLKVDVGVARWFAVVSVFQTSSLDLMEWWWLLYRWCRWCGWCSGSHDEMT